MAPHVLLLNILFFLMNGDEISIGNFPFMSQDLDHPLLPNQDFIGFFWGKNFSGMDPERVFGCHLPPFVGTPNRFSDMCDSVDGVEIPRPTTWDVPKTL